MIVITENVTTSNQEKWYRLLKQHNGRIDSVLRFDESNRFTYSFDNSNDYSEFCKKYRLLTTPIVEKQPSRLQKIKRRLLRFWR